jgi:CubicO group peptidase (beta-lactamase class C family)
MRPLGMASTGYEVTDWPAERRATGYRWENERHTVEPTMRHGEFGAMGGVQTSANDYARWIAFLLSAWPARDGADAGPVRRASVRALAQGLNFPSVRPLPGQGSADGCPMATAYGAGFIAGRHCDLGQVMFHGGGYPGYGSFLLLLPDHGIGIFAFANRTYAGPIAPVFGTAQVLQKAGLLTGRTLPVTPALAETYRAARAMWQAGRVQPGRDRLAMNFLMDRSAENWAREFARLKERDRACRTDAPITATGALAGRFTWTCEKADLAGDLLLAPTNPPGIQALRLAPVATQR